MYIGYCKNCGDAYSLKNSSLKHCSCEQTGAMIDDDKIKIDGDPFFIEISDASFGEAILNQTQNGGTVPINLDAKLICVDNDKFERI